MHAAIKYAEQICYSSKEVLHFTYEMSQKYAGKQGVYVECGVAAGAQIIAMAAGAPNKTIYAFDSFEGIPLPSNKDNQMPGIRFLTKDEQAALPNPGEQVLESSGATSVSLEDFQQHIKASEINMPERIFPVKGWFEKTVPHFAEIEKYIKGSIFEHSMDIAILRLDGDLYNSTYVCLKYLFPKVIEGGIIILDDFALPGCRQAVVDYQVNVLGYYYEPNVISGNGSLVAYWYKKDGTFHPDQPK